MNDGQPPHSYTIHFDGQGGVAGFGKGSADVALAAEGEQTRLRYDARAQVGGKMAQVGSRLIDAAAAKMTEGFRSEEHTSELQSLMRISYAVFCLKKKKITKKEKKRNNSIQTKHMTTPK